MSRYPCFLRSPTLPVNASEARLFETAQRSFLKLWSYANPYRATGKEIADLLVIFGNDVIVFSDKQSTFRDDGYGWQRWYRRTVTASIKQLSGIPAPYGLVSGPQPISSGDTSATGPVK